MYINTERVCMGDTLRESCAVARRTMQGMMTCLRVLAICVDEMLRSLAAQATPGLCTLEQTPLIRGAVSASGSSQQGPEDR